MGSHGFPWVSMGFHGFPWVATGAHGFPVLRVSCDSLPHGGHGGRWPKEIILPRLPSVSGWPVVPYSVSVGSACDEWNAPTIITTCFQNTAVLFRKHVHRPSRRCFIMRAKMYPNQKGWDLTSLLISRYIAVIVNLPRPWPCLASSASSRSSVGGFSPDL